MQGFLKCGLWTSEGPEGQNYFYNNTKMLICLSFFIPLTSEVFQRLRDVMVPSLWQLMECESSVYLGFKVF